jgi:hypothetical protein
LKVEIHQSNGSSEGLHILYRAAAGDATHDAEDRFPQPRCHPETRKKMLDVLWNWTCGIEPPTTLIFEDYENVHASDNSSSDTNFSPIVWLHGPAGAGKSAIAQSLCQKLEEEGHLRASFFFKRGHPSRGPNNSLQQLHTSLPFVFLTSIITSRRVWRVTHHLLTNPFQYNFRI